MSQLSKEEHKTMADIVGKYYMPPIINALENDYFPKYGVLGTLDHLHDLIVSAKGDVESLLVQRKKSGQIKSLDQTRKSVVGNIFPSVIVYIFLKAKLAGLVPQDLFITGKTSNKLFSDYVTIFVGDETQKPDMDIIFYRARNNILEGCIIVSLKTSLRERAGQTYKWKLLLEIAATENEIKQKYKIRFNVKHTPKVCFATINFYDEINQPQHRGMFQFFDGAFIGKPIDSSFIKTLSHLFIFADQETRPKI